MNLNGDMSRITMYFEFKREYYENTMRIPEYYAPEQLDTDSAMFPVQEFSSKRLGVGQFDYFLFYRNDQEVVNSREQHLVDE